MNDTSPLTNLSQNLTLGLDLEAVGLGVWRLDPATDLLDWDDQCRALFGLLKDN